MAKKVRNHPPEVLWIKKNKDFINIKAIEQHLGIPAKCLNNFCRGFYGVHEQYWPKIVAWVREFVEISQAEPQKSPTPAPVGDIEPVTVQVKKLVHEKSGAKTASNDFLENRRRAKGQKP